MTDQEHERNATLTLSLAADSGYRSTEGFRINVDQYRRILRICHEPDHQKEDKDDGA
jgi:hypothetical protein